MMQQLFRNWKYYFLTVLTSEPLKTFKSSILNSFHTGEGCCRINRRAVTLTRSNCIWKEFFFYSFKLLLFPCNVVVKQSVSKPSKLPAVITSLDSTLYHCHQQGFSPKYRRIVFLWYFFSGLISSKYSIFSL